MITFKILGDGPQLARANNAWSTRSGGDKVRFIQCLENAKKTFPIGTAVSYRTLKRGENEVVQNVWAYKVIGYEELHQLCDYREHLQEWCVLHLQPIRDKGRAFYATPSTLTACDEEEVAWLKEHGYLEEPKALLPATVVELRPTGKIGLAAVQHSILSKQLARFKRAVGDTVGVRGKAGEYKITAIHKDPKDCVWRNNTQPWFVEVEIDQSRFVYPLKKLKGFENVPDRT